MKRPPDTRVPGWASDMPAAMTEVKHIHLPFYCINCTRKAETWYLTSNFGPFCAECLKEIEPLLKDSDG